MHTDVGSVRIDVPRDRNGEFEPQIVPKHARRVEGFDESIISLYAKGLTTGEIYAASTEAAAEARFAEFAEQWESRYPAMITVWRNSWEQFTPFLKFPAPIRKLVYTTNAIESLNSRFRHAANRRGHFPNEQAALKVLYLAIRNPLKDRQNITGRIGGWKDILNTLAIFYGERITG